MATGQMLARPMAIADRSPLDAEHQRVEAAADTEKRDVVALLEAILLDGDRESRGKRGGARIAEVFDRRQVERQIEAEPFEEQLAVGAADLVRDDSLHVAIRPAEHGSRFTPGVGG